MAEHNDNRSVNAAAARVGVPMIAAELGGGGNVSPELTDIAEAGLLRCMAHLGITRDTPPKRSGARRIEIASPHDSVFAPGTGLFDRSITAGQSVQAGDRAGCLRFPDDPARPALDLTFPNSGFVLAHGNRGMVRRGDLLALVAQDVSEGH